MTSEITAAFVKAMEAEGIRPLKPIADQLPSGNWVRYRVEGDKPGRENGWARLCLASRPYGYFGHFRLGISAYWRPDGGVAPLTLSERRDIALELRRNEAERRNANEKAAQMAQGLWNGAAMADPAHPYLQRKALAPFGIRQRGQELLVPMWDASFRLWNVQRIDASCQSKRFLKGGRTAGLFWAWGTHRADGRVSDSPLVIAEGYGTAAAIHEATGFAVAAAMMVKNLGTVADIMGQMFASRDIIIAADYDGHLDRNIGMEAALEAARRINAVVANPASGRPSAGLKIDFADLLRSETAAIIEAMQRKDIQHA